MAWAFIDLKKQYETLQLEMDEAVLEVLRQGRYINGPEVAGFEKALAGYVGVEHAVAVANGTEALLLPLLHWGVGPGDAVFCPSFTFIATAEVVVLLGATPVFVEIDPRTYTLCPRDLAAKIEAVKREGRLIPRAVMPVDLFGLPADYPAIGAVAGEHGLKVLEDAAQGFGGRIGAARAGSFGAAAGLSFFPAKPLGGYGDGGAILTRDAELAEALRSIRTHGAGAHKYEHVRLGVNSRLDTLQAAVLLVKLRAFPGELEERQRVAASYTAKLAGALETPFVPGGCLSSWAQYTVRTPAEKRQAIMDGLQSRGVPTMVYYPKPLHLQPVFGGRPGLLPVSEKAAREVMSLPMHPYLTEGDITAICDAVKSVL